MVPPKPTFCTLLLALLCFVPGWARPGACSVAEVLRHYRAVIFEDLQAAVRRLGPESGSGYHHLLKKNLTGPGGGQGRPSVSCDARKEHSILLSIKSLGQTLRGAVTGGRRGTLEKTAWTVALRTEAVMRRHCWKPHQSRQPKMRPVRSRAGRRRHLLHVLDTVATCWEKLFALRAAATGKS